MNAFEKLCPWLDDALGRLDAAAAAGRLGHGWLISAPPGTGKANLAYILADRLLARRCGDALPEPAQPRAIVAAYDRLAEGFDLHPDLHRVWANDERYKKDKEKEKRTISVEQIRDMTADLQLKPHTARLKVVIIERAESMTSEAANALLKSLEEPTPDTFLMLLANRPGRLPATIRSRCQQLHLHLPEFGMTRRWLAADGLDTESLPPAAMSKPPIDLARLISDESFYINYISLHGEINSLFSGRSDPFGIAENWQSRDTELALNALIENLHARIRDRIAPGHSKSVTDNNQDVTDNMSTRLPTETLFASLKMAENLREQLGRGTNVELALKAVLLELDPPQSRGVNA